MGAGRDAQEFFSQRVLTEAGVPILSHACVCQEALEECKRRVDALLAECHLLRANLVSLGCEVHVIGKDQPCSALPEYQHLSEAEKKARELPH